MPVKDRVWKAVRWGASKSAAFALYILTAAWNLVAPWLPYRQAPALTKEPAEAATKETKAACCDMDLSAERKNRRSRSCRCKFNTVLYVNLAPKYGRRRDSFEEAERQVHLTVRKAEMPRTPRASPSPDLTASGPVRSASPAKAGRGGGAGGLTLRQGSLLSRHRPPDSRHMRATNL